MDLRTKSILRFLLFIGLVGGVSLTVEFKDARKQYEELETNGVTVPGKIVNASARSYRTSPITVIFTTLDGNEINFTQNKISREFEMAHFKGEITLTDPYVSVRYLPKRPHEPLLLGNFGDQNSKSAESGVYFGGAMIVLALVVGWHYHSKWL